MLKHTIHHRMILEYLSFLSISMVVKKRMLKKRISLFVGFEGVLPEIVLLIVYNYQ